MTKIAFISRSWCHRKWIELGLGLESQELFWKSLYCSRALEHPWGHQVPALAKEALEHCSLM